MEQLPSRLLVPALRAALIAGGAAALFSGKGLLFRWSGLSFPYLLWVLLASIALMVAEDLLYWLTRGTGLRLLLQLTGVRGAVTHRERFQRRLLIAVLQRLLVSGAGLVLLYGLLTAVPRTAATVASHPDIGALDSVLRYLTVFGDMAPWALGVMTPFALAYAASRALSAIGYLVRVPWYRLLALATAYVLLAERGTLSIAFGFDGSTLLLAAAVGLGLSCLGETIDLVPTVLEGFLRRSSLRWRGMRVGVVLAGGLVGASGGAVLVWGILSTLPSVSATLLDHGPTASIGRTVFPYCAALFDARHLAAGLWLALLVVRGLSSSARPQGSGRFAPFAQAIGLSVAACLAWLVGATLNPLGRGFPLAGATVAAGLFAIALARLGQYARAPSARWSLLADAAGWLQESNTRAFSIGASIALYGLLLRPLFYSRLWFAPIYEWIVVLAIATVLMMKMRVRLARSSGRGPHRSRWAKWSRHRQKVEARPDPYFQSLVRLQRGFADTGRWAGVWAHLLMVMLMNEAPLEAIPPVFGPISKYRDARYGWVRWPGKASRVRSRRRAARRAVLAEAVGRVGEALSMPARPLPPIDAPMLRASGESFVVKGDSPVPLAVMLVAASWQRGVSLSDASLRWFWLLSYADDPIRWFHRSWLRRRVAHRNQARRQELLKDVVEQVYEPGALEGPLVIPAREAWVTDHRYSSPKTVLVPGSPVEILGEDGGFLLVRTEDDFEGYVRASALVQQPLLASERYG